MSKVKWTKRLGDDVKFVSAVKVVVLKLSDYRKFDSDEFIFVIGCKNKPDMLGLESSVSYYLNFEHEDSYKEFVDRGEEKFPSAIFVEPMLFRSVDGNTDFLADEAEDTEAYYTITGMIMSKLYELL